MLNEGKYTARAAELAWQTAQNGNTYLTLRFTVTDGESAGESATKNMFFSEKALQRTVEDLRLLGWTGDDPSTITPSDIANEASITVEHETYTVNGEDRTAARVKWINSLHGLKSSADPSAVASFGAQLKARIRAIDAAARAAGTARPAPAQQPARSGPPRGFAQPSAEDDVPF